MEQIIEEYGIGGILFVIGTGVLAGLGKVLQLIAGVRYWLRWEELFFWARWDSFYCPDRD